MSINPLTNTAEQHLSKADHGMALDGNQQVWEPRDPVDVTEHLPYSAANGAPTHDVEFLHGRGFTEVADKIQSGSGQVAI